MTTRKSRKRIVESNPETKRAWNMKTRYGLTPQQYTEMMKTQAMLCALCGGEMARPVIDHDHQTGRVRGILCHPCNIKLPVVEDMGWIMLAWAYLEES
jgi:hypothetical protein